MHCSEFCVEFKGKLEKVVTTREFFLFRWNPKDKRRGAISLRVNSTDQLISPLGQKICNFVFGCPSYCPRGSSCDSNIMPFTQYETGRPKELDGLALMASEDGTLELRCEGEGWPQG